MKKVFIALFGVMLCACSADNEKDGQQLSKEAATIDSSVGNLYESSIQGNCCHLAPYRFENKTNLTLKFASYVGPARALAHRNGFGFYHGWDMNQLPNIFPNLNQPYITFFKSSNATVVLPNSKMENTRPSPILPSGVSPNQNNYFIDLPYLSTTERGFLYEYGKVFFIAYDIYDGPNIVHSGYLKYRFANQGTITPPANFGDWAFVGNQGPNNDPIYFHSPANFNPNNAHHASELVIGNGNSSMPSKEAFSYAGQDYSLQAYSSPQAFKVEFVYN